MRITIKDLENRVKYLNELTEKPTQRYTKKDGKYISNVGHIFISQAYGGCELQQVWNEGGAVIDVLKTGHIPKKELYNQINAFIEGIRFNNW